MKAAKTPSASCLCRASNSAGPTPDICVDPRGWTGAAYRGSQFPSRHIDRCMTLPRSERNKAARQSDCLSLAVNIVLTKGEGRFTVPIRSRKNMPYPKIHQHRISLVAGTILVAVTLLVGISVFMVMQRHAEELLSKNLQSSRKIEGSSSRLKLEQVLIKRCSLPLALC